MDQQPGSASGSNLFGKDMAKSTQAPVFGASADKSVLGHGTFGSVRQSAAPDTFGNVSEQSPSGFGSFSGTSNQNEPSSQRSASLFGTPKPSGFGTPSFGSLSSQASSKPASFGGFGGQPLFGSAGQNKALSSSVFGNNPASSGNTLFGAGSSSKNGAGFSNKSPAPGLFRDKSVPLSGNPFASSPATTVISSPNVFGSSHASFAVAGASNPRHSSSLGVGDNEGGFRKRSSSGTMGSSVLFGKKQAAKSATASSSAAASFGGQASGNTFRMGTQESGVDPAGEKKLFGKETSSNSRDANVSQSMFGIRPPPYSETGQMFSSTSKSVFSSQIPPVASSRPVASNVKEVPAFSTSPPALFGKSVPAPSGSSDASSRGTGNVFPVASSSAASSTNLFGKGEPSSQNVFGKTGQNTDKGLFGKGQSSGTSESSSAGLFGAGKAEPRQLFQGHNAPESGHRVASSSKQLFQPEHGTLPTAASPSKRSLSKWNRNRDPQANVEKKRTGEEEDTREPKRVRGSDSQDLQTSPSSRLSSTRQSIDDQSQRTSIIVKDIPMHLNKGGILRKHFSQFGAIKRLQPLPIKSAANISFHTHEEAKAAKEKGKHLGKGPPLTIFWRATGKSPGTPTSVVATRSPEGRQRQGKSQRQSQGGVQDELASMAGTFDHQDQLAPQKARPRDPPQRQEFQPLPSSSQSQLRSAERRSPTPPRRLLEDTESQGLPDVEIAKKLIKIMWKARPKDATEIVAVLDARDKFLRLVQRRRSNLSSTGAFIGTCENMCTEKERYYREDIRRLALYEVIPSTLTSLTGLKSKVDHSRAVKEYSRSSADQEEPLPHELRPLRVLMTTMNYLLSEVADQGGEGKWSEWYDFLWNRTRGIRKDITQQQLCEVEVAQLLEKCTRFHIFCSARLCEEDMMSFDAKINNENLTKCLQTVKELYADLEKTKVHCPNEAEFRAYMVLMNLNQGDTLREVQQLRPEIRESAYIHFALKAYHALNSSNFVRFFRLIRQATFLNACILHRYFNQIRGQALRIIMKAHRATGKNRVMYPVHELIRLLGFEDNSQVENFCDHYCLTVEGNEIVMDAQAFLEPETSIPEMRSPTLVEAKRSVTVGEIINGCPLPPLQLPTPTSSFDDTGTFIMPTAIQEALSKGLIISGSALASHPQSQRSVMDDVQQPQEVPAPDVVGGLPNAMEVQRGRAMYSNEAIKSEVRALILEELDIEIQKLAKEVISEEGHHSSLVMGEVESVASSTVQDISRELAEEVIEEEEAKMRQKLAQEMAAQRQRVFTALCEDVVEDTVSELAAKLAGEEMTLVKKELHQKCLQRCSLELRDDLVTGSVEAMILDVAQEVFEVDVLAKRERLAATEACVQGLRCRRFFQMWQRKYVSQIRVKRAMLDFPSTAPNRPPREQLQQLIPDRPDSRLSQKSFFIGDRAKLRVQTPMEVIQQQLYLKTHLSMASARSMLASLVLWKPLDLSHTVIPQLYKAFEEWHDNSLIEADTTPLQWKLCVSVPKKEASTTEQEANFVKWIRAKLCRDSRRDDLLKTIPSAEGEVLSLYHVNTDGSKRDRSIPLGVCIRAFHGKWTDDQEIMALNKSLLKGMSALLFVCSSAEDLSAADPSAKASLWKKERARLHQMLKQKPKTPSVPLVLIVPRLTGEGQLSVLELDTELQLSELRKSGLLSMVQVSHIFIGAQDHPIEFFSDWSSQLSNCLRFAATHVPAPPKLWAKPVSSYVEGVVIEHFKAPVYQDLRTRTRLQLLHQSPNTLISLYNDVIEHIALVCASDDLRHRSWPAPEFDKSTVAKRGPYPGSHWNTDAHMCSLYELVVKMRLPYFRYSDMEAEDWATACRDVWTFLDTVTKKDGGSAKISLFQQTAQLLIRTKKSFDQLCWLASEDGPCEPAYTNMTWTDLIDACVQYKLLCLRSGHLDIRKPDDDEESDEKVEDYEEVLVYYSEDELNDYEPPDSWTDALRDTETAEHGQLKTAVRSAAAKRDQRLLEESATRENITTHQDNTAPSQVEELDDSWAVLKHRLEQERAATESFQARLTAAISPTAGSASPCHFGAYISPIQVSSKENIVDSKKSKNLLVSSVLNEPCVSPESHLMATPRRSLPRKDRSEMLSLRRHKNVAVEIQGDVSRISSSMEDMDTTASQQEDDRMLWAESSMSEKVMTIQERIASQKQEDVLFEMKLRRMMESSPLLL